MKELRQVATATESTLQMDINITDDASYSTGENLVLYPMNSKSNVQKAKNCLNLGDGTVLRYDPIEFTGKAEFPNHISLDDLLFNFVDLQGALKKNHLKRLAEYCSDKGQKDTQKQ